MANLKRSPFEILTSTSVSFFFPTFLIQYAYMHLLKVIFFMQTLGFPCSMHHMSRNRVLLNKPPLILLTVIVELLGPCSYTKLRLRRSLFMYNFSALKNIFSFYI